MRTVSHSGAQFGSVVVHKVQTLNYWAKNYIKRGRVPMVTRFDAQELENFIDDYPLSVQSREIGDDTQHPKTFKYDDWIYW